MKAIKVPKLVMPILVIAALLGSVWVTKAAGIWKTSGRGDVLLDASGRPDPAGIKGWMTLHDLSETYGIPREALYAMLGAGPDLPDDTEMKELEAAIPGMSVSLVREGVAAYLDGSWTPEDGPFAGIPAGADEPEPAPTPLPTAVPTAEHTPKGTGEGSGPAATLPADGSALPAAEIKGRMTLQEVADLCRVPLETLVSELGLPTDVDTGLALRDIAGRYGVEVSVVREVVERLQKP